MDRKTIATRSDSSQKRDWSSKYRMMINLSISCGTDLGNVVHQKIPLRCVGVDTDIVGRAS